MYNLGDHFKFDISLSKANSEVVFKGKKYRISVLTERLVRLEYSESGIFLDEPTELVWYRNFKKPEFTVEENDHTLKITTKYFELFYKKERPFYAGKFSPASNLKISLIGNDKAWFYKHPEVRNYDAIVYRNKNSLVKEKGMYSQEGFTSIDDSDSYIILENGEFRKREEKCIDTYVFMYNKDFYFCLSDYFALTSYPSLIPRYALGNWWCKNDTYDEIGLTRLVKRFEDNDVPISVLMINLLDQNKSLTDVYKEPKLISDYLKSKGVKLAYTLKDYKSFNPKDKDFDLLKEYLEVDNKGNIPFNILNPKVVDAYLKLIIHPLNNFGVDIYALNDFNINDLHRLNILKHYLYTDMFLYKNKRPLISALNTTIAPHRYPILYSGRSIVSWKSLKEMLEFNVSASNRGISFWSHDIGGTSGGIEDNELFTRYVQLGTFSPILRLGSDKGKYYKREPLEWGVKTSLITSDYLRLRYKLIPYIYTEAYKYFKYGKPLIEPLYYRYPNLYDDPLFKFEYFFGTSFLISPIYNKKDYIMNRVIHKIFIPDGIWYDFFNGKKYTGNKKYVSFYKDEEYPVFVKAGAIIPLSNNKFNSTSVPKRLEIAVFPGDNNTYSIYEDDGETNNYQSGEYMITNIEFLYKKNNYSLTLLPVGGRAGVLPKTRDYKIRFKNTRSASRVLSYAGSNQVENRSYRDGTDLVIEIDNVPTISQLTIICSGDNIEIEAMRIINEDISSIISDLPIKTTIKDKIDSIMFSTKLELKKKRIEIRKLGRGKDYLERKYIDLFLKLLEYIDQV